MFKITTYHLVYISFIATILSCSPKPDKRPSPLTMDSVMLNGNKVKITYSSPSVRKRKIWGDLVPYGEVWRTGANEATYLKTETDIKINNQDIPKGEYAIFTIPTDSTWTVILNKEWNQWGSYNYDSTLDILRQKVIPVKKSFTEQMKFKLDQDSIYFRWENLGYSLSISKN